MDGLFLEVFLFLKGRQRILSLGMRSFGFDTTIQFLFQTGLFTISTMMSFTFLRDGYMRLQQMVRRL